MSDAPDNENAAPRPTQQLYRQGGAMGDVASDVTLPKVDEDGERRRRIDGRYEVLGLVGRGGMGNVYKVRDRELDDVVALKALRRESVMDPDAVARFRREVKLARRVTHRNVARTYDIGIGQVPYLTMEFIEGRPLGRVMRAKEADWGAEDIIRVARGVCRGLAAAHEAGVVHRDLKPANVLVSDRRVAITDFGIARAVKEVEGGLGASRSGPIGTPAYMAPEQVEDDETIDGRADIYAFGIMMWEMLTGEVPWVGDKAIAVAAARLLNPPPKLPDDGPWPPALARLVERCLARRPEHRFQSAHETLEALEAVRESRESGSGGAAGQGGPATRTGGWAKWRELSVGSAQPARASHQSSQPTVAVLPLTNRGPNADDYRADGVTEEIIDELSRSDGVRVLPRGAVMGFEGYDVNPIDVGRRLGVPVVVDGSILRIDDNKNGEVDDGDLMRVRMALISVDEGFQLRAERYEGRPPELLELSQRAARDIARSLTSSEEELPEPSAAAGRQGTASGTEAVDLFLKARHLLHSGWHGELQPAIETFEQALAHAPEDARVMAGLSRAHARAAYLDHDGGREHVARARELADRAVELEPDRPEPHFALATVDYFQVDFPGALQDVERALELAPDLPEALELYGRILLEVGDIRRAMEHAKRAIQLNGRLPHARVDLARGHALLGEWDHTDAWLESPVQTAAAEVDRFAARRRLDLWRPTPRWLEAERPEALDRESRLAWACRLQRRLAAGESVPGRIFDEFAEAIPERAVNLRFWGQQMQLLAEMTAAAGERERAIDILRAGARGGLRDLNWLDHCPLFEGWRDGEEIQEIRAELAASVS